MQNDIVAIADANGDTVARYTYDAWGVPTITQDTTTVGIATINPFRYRGYYYDAEIGMYYLQSRYYDPIVGRFVNGDDVACLISGESAYRLHLFSYCENNPCNNIDVLGMWIQFAVGAIVGGLLSVIFYIVDCVIYKTAVNFWKVLLNFLNGAVNGIIAASGAGAVKQIIAGIACSVISLFIGAGKPTFEDLIIAVICGILSGLLGGTVSKGNGRHINYLMKKFGKKIAKSIFKSSFAKKIMNAIKYVFKNCKKILWQFIKSYCIPNAGIGVTVRVKTVLGV